MLVKGFILVKKMSFPGKLTHAKERLGCLEELGDSGTGSNLCQQSFPTGYSNEFLSSFEGLLPLTCNSSMH